ncbi:Mannan endo-1,4-beta-mannosidase 2 [Ancistrocladus abbreviatus]
MASLLRTSYNRGSLVIALVFLGVHVRSFEDSLGFVQVRNTEFVVNGSPFYFNGFNAYWMMHVAAETSERHKVSNLFAEAVAAGLCVCRTWAFSDGGYRALQISPGVYDERVFQANKYRVRLILSLSNNYHDFGGKAQYVNWAKDAGVPVNSEDDFYSNPVVKDHYKNHVMRVLTRINTITGVAYKDDPIIMAWELMNEPRCLDDSAGITLNRWVEEMSSFVKSLDNKHLVEIGMEGFYGDSMPEKKQLNPGYQVGTDFLTNNLIEDIDFATIHAYPDQWLPGQNEKDQMEFVQRWLSSHLTDSRTILKKPLVFAEFGKSKKAAGYSINERDAYLNMIYNATYNSARSGGGIGGGLVWQIMTQGMESFYDGYEIILSQDSSTNGVIATQSQQMAGLAHVQRLVLSQCGEDFER